MQVECKCASVSYVYSVYVYSVYVYSVYVYSVLQCLQCLLCKHRMNLIKMGWRIREYVAVVGRLCWPNRTRNHHHHYNKSLFHFTFIFPKYIYEMILHMLFSSCHIISIWLHCFQSCILSSEFLSNQNPASLCCQAV